MSMHSKCHDACIINVCYNVTLFHSTGLSFCYASLQDVLLSLIYSYNDCDTKHIEMTEVTYITSCNSSLYGYSASNQTVDVHVPHTLHVTNVTDIQYLYHA